jgi:hypothetical protein
MNVPTAEQPQVGPTVYGGLFFTTLSTLMHEILLTRIFSVKIWYHFAFVAVSVSPFGMTVGALIIYLSPQRFPQGAARHAPGLHRRGWKVIGLEPSPAMTANGRRSALESSTPFRARTRYR